MTYVDDTTLHTMTLEELFLTIDTYHALFTKVGIKNSTRENIDFSNESAIFRRCSNYRRYTNSKKKWESLKF